MMKSFTCSIWAYCYIVLFMLVCASGAIAKSDSTISVHQEHHALVAPAGKHYQWFKDEVPLSGERGRELSVTESGHYSVEVVDEVGAVFRQEANVAVSASGAIIKIYIIGDSTVCNYPASGYPQTGWGQLLPKFFNANISISNNAIGGRSSKSFYKQGRWTPIKTTLAAGDYVFIQFGHNDRDFSDTSRYTSIADYKSYLTMYCNDAKSKGAIPVLVSPMVMNAWTGITMRNVFTENGNNYRGAMLEVATALNVAFVDLNMKSWNLYKTYGSAYNQRFLYKGFVEGEYPNYPTGFTDGTHFQEMGSLSHCRMITEGIKELSARTDMVNLINNLKPLFPVGISVNPTSGSDSMTTKAGTYPEGVTVTLKTIPKAKSAFLKWNDANGSQVAATALTTVLSTASAGTYTAVYKGAVINDCNGTPNGTAKLDNCERCVAGTTGKTACTSVGEAETDACAYSGILESTNTGFKGASYINVTNEIGASIAFNINVSSAGVAILSFRYANGGANDRLAQLNLNNTLLSSRLSFPVTGAFTTWKTVDLTLSLLKGTNTLKLSSSTAEGLPNIDQIGYVTSGLAKGNCVVTGIVEMEEVELYYLYPNPFTSTITISVKGDFQYSVLNATGQVVETGTAYEQTSIGNQWPSGVYVVKIQQANTSKVLSVVKK